MTYKQHLHINKMAARRRAAINYAKGLTSRGTIPNTVKRGRPRRVVNHPLFDTTWLDNYEQRKKQLGI
jgi:hypothetical protein